MCEASTRVWAFNRECRVRCVCGACSRECVGLLCTFPHSSAPPPPPHPLRPQTLGWRCSLTPRSCHSQTWDWRERLGTWPQRCAATNAIMVTTTTMWPYGRHPQHHFPSALLLLHTRPRSVSRSSTNAQPVALLSAAAPYYYSPLLVVALCSALPMLALGCHLQALSSAVEPASDVWAAGVMAYQLLSGRFPFDDWSNPSSPALSLVRRAQSCSILPIYIHVAHPGLSLTLPVLLVCVIQSCGCRWHQAVTRPSLPPTLPTVMVMVCRCGDPS